MPTLNKIREYISSASRNKIIFCKDDLYDISFVNVGHEVAYLLNNGQDPMSVFSTVKKNESIGNYLAIENIGILFEPELMINIPSILDSYSRSQCLIIKSEGVIHNGYFYLMSIDDNVKVSLDGLSYQLV